MEKKDYSEAVYDLLKKNEMRVRKLFGTPFDPVIHIPLLCDVYGISQRQLGVASGTNSPSISRIVKGKVSPNVRTINRMLEPFGLALYIGDLTPPEENVEKDGQDETSEA